jgi:phosphomethylpyrimidine synthase
MTQMELAKKGVITEEVKSCARAEDVDDHIISRMVAEGSIIITKNRRHESIKPLAIGKGLQTKVNANVGTSRDCINIEEELEKVRVAIEAGADTIMDLSTGGNLREIRKTIIRKSTVPVGTVPIYQAAIETVQKRGDPIVEMTIDDILQVIQEHAEDGTDFITVHCGVTQESVARLKKEGRLLDVVSRGGAFITGWMIHNDKENPLYESFDRLLEIAKSFDMVLSLGDGLRPGCLADATDRGQIQELVTLGELTQRACKQNVQVMIEGPGHVPIDQIEANVLLEKRLCHDAPFYVLGPLVTDIAPGYDHITSAIGGAIAASAGADFLCYVTPSEHLRLPTIEDVREGVIASKIAAHAADIAKGVKGALNRDIEIAKSRKRLDWGGQINCSLDSKKARALRESRNLEDSNVCSMCGEYCAIKILRSYFEED